MTRRRQQRSHLREQLLQIWMPGIILALAALVAVLVVTTLDAARSEHYRSIGALLVPAASGAAWTMALVGTAEGVGIAIVIVVVVLGVQLTADRYSPRIIDIFVRDPMNGLVLTLFLGSIVFTILISAEIKEDHVPLYGVGTAVLLAVVDFAVLLPYVRYMFSIMRAETIIRAVRGRAGAELHRVLAHESRIASRHAVRDCMAQIADIALGSIQEGDTEVCLSTIEAFRELLVDEYVPAKARLPDLEEQAVSSRAGTSPRRLRH